ncbi:MAG: hypothetical protein LBD06_03725 [Candidatus Accumulibacter sp.]|jgi:hypothetical protein|nr:hypothetical protein [Accumulibacter sp.]
MERFFSPKEDLFFRMSSGTSTPGGLPASGAAAGPERMRGSLPAAARADFIQIPSTMVHDALHQCVTGRDDLHGRRFDRLFMGAGRRVWQPRRPRTLSHPDEGNGRGGPSGLSTEGVSALGAGDGIGRHAVPVRSRDDRAKTAATLSLAWSSAG